ncbi:MAG TPA: transcriptional regulator [Hyphomicrobiaceae bacterium]
MNQLLQGVLRFDRFALDVTRGCLRVGDEELALRPKAFEVLRYLAQNAGRLVSKQELFDAVWPDVTVSEAFITQCIRELRERLGDNDHRLIKTVSRRGYLLDTAVTVEAPPAPDRPAAGMSPEIPRTQLAPPQSARVILPRRILPHRLGAWAGAAALVLGVAGWLTYVSGWSATGPAAPAQLERPGQGGQFDGVWRVEFSHNEHCTDRRPFTTLWMIRQDALVTGKTRGTVSGTGELRGTTPAVADPALSKVVSAKLRGGRGEGEWVGLHGCAGAIALTRVSGP